MALFLFIVAADSTIGVVNPLLYRQIIDDGIIKHNARLIIRLALITGALSTSDAVLGVVQAYMAARIGAQVVLDLRVKLFERIQEMPLAFFTHAQTGALVSRLNNDVNGARTAFTDVLSNVLGNLTSVVLVIAVMAVLSWRITIAALVLIPFFIFPAHFCGRKLQLIAREISNSAASINNLMIERFNVAGALLAKLFGCQQQDKEEFQTEATRVSTLAVKNAVYGRLFFTAMFVTATLATTLSYGWGGILAVRHLLDVGTVVALVSYIERLYTPLIGLSNIQVSIMTARVSFDRVFEVLDLPPIIRQKTDASRVPAGPATITFDHVSFRYPNASELCLGSLKAIATRQATFTKTVLYEITFTVRPKTLMAIVGPSGAGKTTIAHLAARLYDVRSGFVLVNGVDVRDVTLASLRERIGMITQDTHFFHDTIRANLLYAKRGASDEEIHDALRAAQILPLIDSLPEGLDTLVGERGYHLSGGEKQRLAIARLLLKAPDIVILDEATAHLDAGSEAAIQEALDVALMNRTSIVVAHRLSTILKADQILVMQAGRIVQRGTHVELLQHRGLYADMYSRQFALARA